MFIPRVAPRQWDQNKQSHNFAIVAPLRIASPLQQGWSLRMPHDGQALRHRIQGLLHRTRQTVRIADVSASGEAVRHCTHIRSHTLFTHTTVAVRSWLRPVPWRQVGGVEITCRMLPSHCFIVFLRPIHQGTTLRALCLSDAGSLRIDVILLILAISFQCRGFSPSLHMHIGSAKSHRAFPNKQKASHSPRCLILFACFGIYPKLSHWQRRLTDLYRQVVAWRIPMSVLLKPRGSCFVFLRLACLYQCSDWDAPIFRIVITLWAFFLAASWFSTFLFDIAISIVVVVAVNDL